MNPRFEVVAPFAPAGDQPKAIAELTAGLRAGRQVSDPARRHRVGQDDDPGAHHRERTASRRWSCPTTRPWPPSSTASCASSCPRNAVEYFVSYYDYYQPEAYVPSTDVYIEKDASINQDIESLRLRATSSLMEREDVVIVATVSAIYGLGDPLEYRKLHGHRRVGASSGAGTTS